MLPILPILPIMFRQQRYSIYMQSRREEGAKKPEAAPKTKGRAERKGYLRIQREVTSFVGVSAGIMKPEPHTSRQLDDGGLVCFDNRCQDDPKYRTILDQSCDDLFGLMKPDENCHSYWMQTGGRMKVNEFVSYEITEKELFHLILACPCACKLECLATDFPTSSPAPSAAPTVSKSPSMIPTPLSPASSPTGSPNIYQMGENRSNIDSFSGLEETKNNIKGGIFESNKVLMVSALVGAVTIVAVSAVLFAVVRKKRRGKEYLGDGAFSHSAPTIATNNKRKRAATAIRHTSSTSASAKGVQKSIASESKLCDDDFKFNRTNEGGGNQKHKHKRSASTDKLTIRPASPTPTKGHKKSDASVYRVPDGETKSNKTSEGASYSKPKHKRPASADIPTVRPASPTNALAKGRKKSGATSFKVGQSKSNIVNEGTRCDKPKRKRASSADMITIRPATSNLIKGAKKSDGSFSKFVADGHSKSNTTSEGGRYTKPKRKRAASADMLTLRPVSPTSVRSRNKKSAASIANVEPKSNMSKSNLVKPSKHTATAVVQAVQPKKYSKNSDKCSKNPATSCSKPTAVGIESKSNISRPILRSGNFAEKSTVSKLVAIGKSKPSNFKSVSFSHNVVFESERSQEDLESYYTDSSCEGDSLQTLSDRNKN